LGAKTTGECDDTNIASACVAANSDPADDVPAWKRKGVRCGEGSTICLDSSEKYFPACFMVRILDGSIYSSKEAFSVTAELDQDPSQSLQRVSGCNEQEGERAVLVKYTQIFVSLCVSFVVFNWRVDTDCFERGLFPARDNVPAESSSSHVIECAKAFGEQERRLKRC
jgi:hypothetical protein